MGPSFTRQPAGFDAPDAVWAQESQVVVLDQDSVTKRLPMVTTAAQRHSPFFQRTQTRRRLSGIDNLCAIPANSRAKSAGQGGHARKMLKKINRYSFRRK